MPTYEFRCPEGHEFEKFYRSIGGAESTAACPVCGERAERMMSAAGFAFKGSGFYLTDYGKNAHRGEAPPDAKAAASAESASDSAKPDSAKSESASSTEGNKADTTKPAESAKPAAEPKKAEPKKSESKPAESKRASKPKPSAGE